MEIMCYSVAKDYMYIHRGFYGAIFYNGAIYHYGLLVGNCNIFRNLNTYRKHNGNTGICRKLKILTSCSVSNKVGLTLNLKNLQTENLFGAAISFELIYMFNDMQIP